MENSITIQEYTTFDQNELQALYASANWVNYARNPELLEAAYRNSLKVLCARTGGELIGIVRAVGDGHFILYIQDILVHPKHQRKGIGRRLMQEINALYPNVARTVIVADNWAESTHFFHSCGYSLCSEHKCTTFLKFPGKPKE